MTNQIQHPENVLSTFSYTCKPVILVKLYNYSLFSFPLFLNGILHDNSILTINTVNSKTHIIRFILSSKKTLPLCFIQIIQRMHVELCRIGGEINKNLHGMRYLQPYRSFYIYSIYMYFIFF